MISRAEQFFTFIKEHGRPISAHDPEVIDYYSANIYQGKGHVQKAIGKALELFYSQRRLDRKKISLGNKIQSGARFYYQYYLPGEKA